MTTSTNHVPIKAK